jgi:hypothetical protein
LSLLSNRCQPLLVRHFGRVFLLRCKKALTLTGAATAGSARQSIGRIVQRHVHTVRNAPQRDRGTVLVSVVTHVTIANGEVRVELDRVNATCVGKRA